MEVTDSDRSQAQGSGEGQEKRNAPTVSKEKWRAHALAKLSRGYFLIVGTQRRSANFYLPGKGYEMCAYAVAQQLIREGALTEAGAHYLGTLYTLSAETAPPPRPVAAPKPATTEDDLTLLLSQDDGAQAGDNGPAAW